MTDKNYLTAHILCRICALPSLGLPIFSETGTQLKLPQQIRSCLGIRVLENDNLPKHICYHCLGKLTFSYAFKQMSLTAQSKIHHLITEEPMNEIPIATIINGHINTPDEGNCALAQGIVIQSVQSLDVNTMTLALTSPSNNFNAVQSEAATTPLVPKIQEKNLSSTTPEKRKSPDVPSLEERAAKRKERKTVCMDCGLWFPRTEMPQHEETVHFKKGLLCLLCNKEFTSQTDWNTHKDICTS